MSEGNWQRRTECLPIMNNCQFSSILQNLDSAPTDQNLQSMDLIILQSNDYKLPLEGPLNLNTTNNYIVLKDSVGMDNYTSTSLPPLQKCSNKFFDKFEENQSKDCDPKLLEPTDLSLNIIETSNSSMTSSISPRHYDRESFEDMLYFVCNLCPFLCTKETKITEHLEGLHKNKAVRKLVQLKCPACTNIFYHKASLKSHLFHDHYVTNNDLSLIVQAVYFYSTKERDKKKDEDLEKTEKLKPPGTLEKKNHIIEQPKVLESEMAMNSDIASKSKLEESEPDVINLVKPGPKLASNIPLNLEMPHLEHFMDVDFQKTSLVENEMQASVTHSLPQPKIPLPQVNITAGNSEKLIKNLMKKSDPIVKYSSQKCVYANCKVSLQNPRNMEYHIESHLNDGFSCLECEEKFNLWKPFTSHLWRMHKVDMELFSCDKCDYKTNSLSKLNTVHKLIHSSIKAFQCDTCQKFFKNQKQLRNHRRIHRENVEVQKEECELCHKTFSTKRRLRSHMDTVHKKLKPYLCNVCGYKGSRKGSLRMHMRSHTGEKPFSCDQCQYTTADHNSLRRHKLRHSGQKPYKCSYCSYACIQSTTYKVHLKTKHPGLEKDLMFTCFMCQFRTVNREMYHSHLMTVHKEKPPSVSDGIGR
ncbi:oocyte zinc finger protein XlCOF6-like isoform X2 [Anthonomus grandis grandis]|uniref:oocyte zinc finger protein XlCOF6-like isoform X2 n=1 Tax=Anthonomus grandis grandis TaxID=2921223 RepID=UPI0021657C06|nr:oocyte zinc finger protein XlCOF6-like isoform X2 [Anthonomus grandis grandis]